MAYDKLSSYKTAVFGEGNLTKIVYQRTAIVTFDRDSVTLRNGGWQTVTTKRKMNQASHQFGLGYSVFQKDFSWFVTLPNGATIPFMDGMTFERVREAA